MWESVFTVQISDAIYWYDMAMRIITRCISGQIIYFELPFLQMLCCDLCFICTIPIRHGLARCL